CRAIFDRRFLIEETFGRAKAEIDALVKRAVSRVPGVEHELRDFMVVDPVQTPHDSPVVSAVERAIGRVLDRQGTLVARPGTYDPKPCARFAALPHCFAYAPAELERAHQPDESCRIDDLVNATKVLALATLDLMD